MSQTSHAEHASQPAAPPRAAPYFGHHVFFCLNQRDGGRNCCANHGAQAAFEHCKVSVKQQGLAGAGKVRINQAGCLGRCAAGPVLVVYPEGVWYRFADNADIDEIVQSHLKNGQIVERLRVPAAVAY